MRFQTLRSPYTRAHAVSNGYLTLLSDGERLTGAHALGPEAGEWLKRPPWPSASASHPLVHQLRHSRPRRPARHESRERRRCRPSGGAARTIDASKRGLAAPVTGARKEPVVFVELDTRQDADGTVSLEWDRGTGETQIVVADIRDESLLVFPVPGANAGEAFRHPFRYAQ